MNTITNSISPLQTENKTVDSRIPKTLPRIQATLDAKGNPGRVARSGENPFGSPPRGMDASRTERGGGLLLGVLCFFAALTTITWPFLMQLGGYSIHWAFWCVLGATGLMLVQFGKLSLRKS